MWTIKTNNKDNATNILFEVRERRVAEKPHTIKELLTITTMIFRIQKNQKFKHSRI